MLSLLLCGFLAVEWSCLKDFSLLAGELILENLQCLKCTITGLTTVIKTNKKKKGELLAPVYAVSLIVCACTMDRLGIWKKCLFLFCFESTSNVQCMFWLSYLCGSVNCLTKYNQA